jgi:hypothetical protein
LATQQAQVFVSFSYVLLRWLLELNALRVRSSELKELEIVVLRHEVAIRRKTRRRAIAVVDRLFLSAASRLLPRARCAFLYRRASDVAAVASTLGCEAVDVRASCRSSADAT